MQRSQHTSTFARRVRHSPPPRSQTHKLTKQLIRGDVSPEQYARNRERIVGQATVWKNLIVPLALAIVSAIVVSRAVRARGRSATKPS